MSLTFEVFGTPIPKGSTKAFMRPGMRFPIVTHDNLKTKPWQEAVVAAAMEARARDGDLPVETPVVLALRFFLPRPKSAPRRVTVPAKKPDLDKLVRCVKDGLTRAGVYVDDAQVIETHARKDFAAGLMDPEGEDGIPRVHIEVEPMAPIPAQTAPRSYVMSSLFDGL